MSRRPTRRAALWGRIWLLSSWVAARRRLRVRAEDVAQQVQPHQTRGKGIRMTEWLRDRLRPGWLRLRRGPE